MSVDAPPKTILLNKTDLVMELGDTETISATVYPLYANKSNIEWSSSDTSVLTVDKNGVATAVGYGNAYVTAITEGGECAAASFVSVPIKNKIISADVNGMTVSAEYTIENDGYLIAVGYLHGRMTDAKIIPVKAEQSSVSFAINNVSQMDLSIYLVDSHFTPVAPAMKKTSK